MSLLLLRLRVRGRFASPSPSLLLGRMLFHMDANKEKELFSVTMYRWLHDEERQRAIRHLPFNVQEFVDVALKAANATECVSLNKVQEGPRNQLHVQALNTDIGLHNRVFALKFDNGVEFIAKIPFPTIGPKHLCTASEVATLDFLRTKLFPVPVVRAWCSRAESSPVGVEYIMYEKIPGIPLVQLDNNDTLSEDLEEDPFIEIAPHIAGVVYFFSRAHFTQFGSIYYKEDMPDSLRGGPFYGVPIEDDTSRFCIGPTVDREFWRAGRAALRIDRGPWPDMRSWMLAASACARASLQTHTDDAFKAEYLRLIADYERLVPHIARKDSKAILWHPDFWPQNIIVSPEKPHTLQGYIDWSGATISPFEMQVAPPAGYDFDEHPHIVFNKGEEYSVDLSSEVDELAPQERNNAMAAYRHAVRTAVLYNSVHEHDAHFAKAMFGPHVKTAKRYFLFPAEAITRGETFGLAFVRYSFVQCRSVWRYFSDAPFPLDISDEDAARISEEWWVLTRKSEERDEMMEQIGLQATQEGMVRAEDYEVFQSRIEEVRQQLAASELPPDEKELVRNWPWVPYIPMVSTETCY
ncbi:hypothetical protein BV20DRAFT_1002906 [Pilatotrama ljubarskyi]|nr:hypothetical protein BV20DRAFT_1002906 [Pilatotrama ljubarskyi]